MSTVNRNDHDQAEIRLLGLILMQSLSIGLAVGIFHSDMWLKHDDPFVNAMTYSMGAFAVQGLAYYVFKMFFQQGMDEKARIAQMERERRSRSTGLQSQFEQRRQDMELRMQEIQLDQELRWLEANPGQTPPWLNQRVGTHGMDSAATSLATPMYPAQEAPSLELGVSFEQEDAPRSSDGKFKKKE